MIVDHLDILFYKVLIEVFCLFFYWVVCLFFLLFHSSSLCSLDIRTLLEVCAELIFSYFLACFFILLIVYVVTKSMAILMYPILSLFKIFDYCFLCPI